MIPPNWLLAFFRWFCHPKFVEDIEGDLLEMYEYRVAEIGRRKANWNFFIEIISLVKLNLIRPFEGHHQLTHYGMFKNYFKIAWRNVLKQKLYSIINITGLAIGISACIIVALFVRDELSFDKYHDDGDRIYRIITNFKNGDSYTTTALSAYRIAPILTENVAAVQDFFRVEYKWKNFLFEVENREFEEELMGYADANFFSFFTIKLKEGNVNTVLAEPYTMAISEKIAEKYFKGENPIGKTVKVTNAYNKAVYEAKVTGVFEEMPQNSHFRKEILISMATADIVHEARTDSWGWTSQYSYIKLAPNTSISEVEKSMEEIIKTHAPKEFQGWGNFDLQPLHAIHLESNLKDEINANSDISYVYIFSTIALFIILIAGINYMNLATARAADRAKEVGLRKTLGAFRRQLIFQFLGEAMLISLFALALAVILSEAALPFFNQLSGKNLAISYTEEPLLIGVFLLSVLAIGVFAGSYPAFYLSKFKPLQVLSGKAAKSGRGTSQFRKVLVVFQFAISTILIIGTAVIYNQWEYLKNKKLGIKKDQIISINSVSNAIHDNYIPLKESLLKLSVVEGVTASNKSMTRVFGNFASFQYPGFEDLVSLPYGNVDGDFFDFYNIDLIQGTGFTQQQADTAKILVNEATVKLLGETNESIIGKEFKFGTQFHPEVVGVVKDFHFESLHKEIAPVYFWHATARDFGYISIKINTKNYAQALDEIEAVFKEVDPAFLFQFSFLEDDLNQLYLAEQRFFKVFTILSVLAIFIGCLGIFGLASFTAQQKRKEIGIRKILGASVSSLATSFSLDFAKLVVVANLIALPIAYFFLEKWLEGFPYKTSLSVWAFLSASLIVLLIAMITISTQSLKTAFSNPVDSLRNSD